MIMKADLEIKILSSVWDTWNRTWLKAARILRQGRREAIASGICGSFLKSW